MASEPPTRRVLYVVWGFVPPAGGTDWDPSATVGALAARGHDVTVLCADRDVFELVLGEDWDPAGRIGPASARVIRVPHPPGAEDPLVNRWPAPRVKSPVAWANMVEGRVRGLHPDTVSSGWLPGWRPAAAAAAAALHEHDPFDLVIADIPPSVAAGVALQLSGSAGVPLALIDRDSWLFDLSTGGARDDADVVRPLLTEIFRRATRVWCVDAAAAEACRREFTPWADKIREVRGDSSRSTRSGATGASGATSTDVRVEALEGVASQADGLKVDAALAADTALDVDAACADLEEALGW